MKIKADNCVRENKNSSVLKLLAFILRQRGLQISGLLCHRVGHTHTAIGDSAN